MSEGSRGPEVMPPPETHREREPGESLVRLKFMRHGEKEAEGADPNLTERGRDQASTAGSEYGPNPNVAVGHGSPRHRTHETVQRFMGVARPDVVRDDMTADEVEHAIAEEMKQEGRIGRKTIADERLNFQIEGEYKDSTMRAIKEKRYLRFLVEKSDQVIIANGDRKSTSLLRQAGNVAELVRNYGGGVARGWRSLVERKPEEFKKFNYELERYLGSHQGIVESFVVKLLREKKGQDAMEEFVDSCPNGFSELGGVEIDVELVNDEPRFTLTYELPPKEEGEKTEKRSVDFELVDLDSILEQRKRFERMVENAVVEVEAA